LSELNTQINQVVDTFKEVREQHGARITEIERYIARMKDPANDNHSSVRGGPSLGEMVIANDEVKRLTSDFRGKAVVKFTGDEVAAITSATSSVGNNTSNGTSLVPAHRVGEIVTPYQRELRVRDLLNKARTTSNTIEWPKETAFDNQARPVTEGQGKPYSNLTFELQSTPVRTIAHMFKCSRQILDDAPALASYINRRGVYGLQQKEEAQLLTGNGVGQNLNGIVPQATAFSPQFTIAHETPIDRILEAISQAEDSEIPVNGVVLNKRDWRRITGVKDEEGRYISGQSPFGLTDPRLWGVNIVATNAMAQGEFLAGAFQDGATIFDRMDVEVMISTENDRDFEQNLVSVRIESRLALAVFRPDAFITGDLYAAST
jgi:HK97 family phage major capsid protein